MNLPALQADLAAEEGEIPHLYLDTKGYPTVGIGHRVEQYYKQGTTISSPEELESTLVQLINRLLHPSP